MRRTGQRTSCRVLFAVSLAGLLSACIPAIVPKITRIEGVLTSDGVPVPDVEVVYTWRYRWPDEAVVLRDTTDAQGRFEFDGEEGFGFFILLPVHSITAIRLSFSTPDSARTAAGQAYHAGPVLSHLQLECDLSRSGPELCRITGPGELPGEERYFWVKEDSR